MKITTKVYIPFYDNNFISAFVGIMEIFNNEISVTGFCLSKFGGEILCGLSKDQKYEIIFLDKYHTDIKNPCKYAKITYINGKNKKETVFIKLGFIKRLKLKYMNNLFFFREKKH